MLDGKLETWLPWGLHDIPLLPLPLSYREVKTAEHRPGQAASIAVCESYPFIHVQVSPAPEMKLPKSDRPPVAIPSNVISWIYESREWIYFRNGFEDAPLVKAKYENPDILWWYLQLQKSQLYLFYTLRISNYMTVFGAMFYHKLRGMHQRLFAVVEFRLTVGGVWPAPHIVNRHPLTCFTSIN